MMLVLKQTYSFYDVLKYFTVSSRMISNIFELITAAGFIIVVSYILYRIHDYRCKRFINESKYNSVELQKFKDYNRSFIRHRSIISHKEMLNDLEYAADNCYQKCYALKCIDIIVRCPQLINVKSPPYGLTPFHRICFQGHETLIDFMLAKGADPFLTTLKGENALCLAIYYFLNRPTETNFSCLNMLVQTGCRFGFEDKWYHSLLNMAFRVNHTKLIEWLILHYNDFSSKALRSSSTPPIIRKDYIDSTNL